jgi:hypothetical protein
MRPEGTYKSSHLLATRATKAASYRAKFTPPRVPVILEHARSTHRPRLELTSTEFMCPPGLPLSEFMLNVRRRDKLPADIAVFLMVKGVLATPANTMGELYEYGRDEDGWMYIVWTEESAFGYV